MILASFNYAAPESLDEAMALLRENKGAQLLAGGHSILNELKLSQASPSMLVDLRKIQELRGIKHHANGSLRIGAMTTFVEIADDKDIWGNYSALTEAANSTPDAQVRNCSTIGGNLAYGALGADLPAVLLAFGARLNIFGPSGTRTTAADEYIAGTTKLTMGEIITSCDFQAVTAGTSSAYEKFKNRASGYALCGVAVKVVLASDGSLCECSVAVTGASKQAMRLPTLEAALKGRQSTAEALVVEQIGEEQNFISDLAASAEYRAYLISILATRALTRAVARAKLAGQHFDRTC